MRSRWLLLVAAILVAALAALATLQYRWIGELAVAEEQRERVAVDFAARHFADDVERELGRTRAQFQQASREELPRRYAEWAATGHDSQLIDSMFLVRSVREGANIERIDPKSGATTRIDWPQEFVPLREWAQTVPPPPHPPLLDEVPALLLPLRPDPQPFAPRPPPPFARNAGVPAGWPGGVPPPRARDASGPAGEPPPRPQFDDRRPPRPRDEPGPPGERPAPRDDERPRPSPLFLIVKLDRNDLGSMFADLSRRYFAGYDVAVAEADTIFFHSMSTWPQSPRDVAELVRPLMMRPGEEQSPRWRLMVRRHGMPMAEVVAATRRRNFLVSVAVVAVLAVSFVLLAVIARRAERLREQQLAFVAGITHELNTPLAAIESAGENLADGIVTGADHVARYGAAIVKESRRLSDIVAQVLAYAGMQGRTKGRSHEPLDVGSLVRTAIARAAWLAEQSGVTIATNVPNDLPQIEGDRELLISAIHNLITNAIRHGGEGQWVGVRAETDRDAVAIVVEDKGRGISPRDLPRLFDPFFRGRSANPRGAGLGLAIVKQIAAAHGGSVTAQRRRERGAAFTLRLPEAQHA